MGQDTERDGLLRTPARVARINFLTSGYHQTRAGMAAPVEGKIRRDGGGARCRLYSLCEHHLLPFGRARTHLPGDKIVGLSKLARIVEMFARRLQVQERLTTEIANAINDILEPKGVGVVVEARHLCMMMRGVEKQSSFAVTSCMLGQFRTDARTRGEFLSLIEKSERP